MQEDFRMPSDTQEVPLPSLRPDIDIYAGPLEEDGSPSFVIHDPVTGAFSKIGWGEAAVLLRLRQGQTLSALMEELSCETTLSTTPEEVEALCEDADKQGLTKSSQIRPPRELLEDFNSKKTSALKWLAGHYLYFRIPLLHPDKYLTRSLPWVKVLASTQAKAIYLFFACIGFYFLSQRFETYVSTFLHFFSLKGFVAYGLVIICLKAAHEFGHAFVAKHLGVRVPTMGIAFMVFAPVAYSDVTDAWRLRSRRKRMAIALAGVKVELVVGALALAFWGLTPPGILNSICFLLSSTTLVSTFLVNLNPAMRFDGYYILSDLWGIDNLSSQTTQFTKWYLRRHLLGIDAPCPVLEPRKSRQFQILLYSLFAWTYRVFLYLGIAVLVYYKFTKTLGIILFSLEIFVFILRPIIEEIKVLIKMKSQIKFSLKLSLVLTVLLLAVGWAVWPLPRTEDAPAVFVPVHSQTVYAPKGAKIKAILVEQGQPVNKGDSLAYLVSESLDAEIQFLSVSTKKFRHDIEALTVGDRHMDMIPEKRKELAAERDIPSGLFSLGGAS